MTPAQEILKLIETVDPTDNTKLNEIDARVWCYLRGYKFLRHEMYNEHTCFSVIQRMRFYYKNRSGKEECYCVVNIDKPSRSRNVLKAIRPEGWYFQADLRFACDIKPEGVMYRFSAMRPDWPKWNPVDIRWIHNIESPIIDTEELAELHAIIQAIEFERTQKGE